MTAEKKDDFYTVAEMTIRTKQPLDCISKWNKLEMKKKKKESRNKSATLKANKVESLTRTRHDHGKNRE